MENEKVRGSSFALVPLLLHVSVCVSVDLDLHSHFCLLAVAEARSM